MKEGSSDARTPGSTKHPIPFLPLACAEEQSIVASLKRARNPINGPATTQALDIHPSVGVFPIDYTLHTVNREKLINKMRNNPEVPSRSVLLFRGGVNHPRNETDNEPLFRQESTFNYLFGVREPDCLATIDLAIGEATLYIPRVPEEYAIWMGEVLPPAHFQENYKIDRVLFVDELVSSIRENGPEKVFVNRGFNIDGKAWAEPADTKGLEGLDIDSSSTLYDAVAECRVIKTPQEIALMQHVNNLTSEGHFEVMRRARPGMAEYQLESMFRHWVYYNGGCRNVAYICICGCGPSSAVLHYGHAGAPNDRIIGENDMLLLDMGGEYHCYTSDVTCSYPASGKFSDRQKIVFEAVRDMTFAVMDAMKPGVPWPSMHELAYRVGCERLKAAGLLKGSVEDMMAANVCAVFMPHGLGHLMGADVHDVGGYITGGRERDPRPGFSTLRCVRDLAVGMVITVEPGIYFIDQLLDNAFADPKLSQYLVADEIAPYRGFGGVRLEDDVLVTEDGVRNLTNCPRTVEDVEGVMSGRISNRRQLFSKFYTDDQSQSP